jgi:hypothetical protein
LREHFLAITRCFIEHREDLIGVHVVAALGYADLRDDAGVLGFEFHHRLVALDLGKNVTGRDPRSHRHVPLDERDGGIVRRYAGQTDVGAHGSRQAAAQASRMASVSMP